MGLVDWITSKVKIPDNVASGLAKTFANSKLNGIGEITRLDLDTSNKLISAEVLLKGEISPIKINTGFLLHERDDKLFITLNQFQSSREWINLLFDRHYSGKPLEIPENIAIGLRMIQE